MTYTVQSGQTVSDVVMATYGDLSFITQFLLDNLFIANVNAVLLPGEEVTWNPSLISTGQPVEVTTVPPAVSTIKTYFSKYGQNLFDVCLQVYGSLDYMYKLIMDNNIPSGMNMAGTNVAYKYDSSLQVDTDFYKFLNAKKIDINTGGVLPVAVYSNEDQTIIYTNEDGSVIYTPE